MAFTDHKITAFTHTISELADQPNLPPDELKARFDACPEQLRVSLNAVCDEAAALDSKVDGILTQTFEGAVDKSMLSPELAAEIDATVTQNELETAVSTLESADSALSTRMSSAESKLNSQATQIAQKCQVYIGTYTGNGTASQSINLGFRPKAVLVVAAGCGWQDGYYKYSALALNGYPANGVSIPAVEVSSTGFIAHYDISTSRVYMCLNQSDTQYYYIVFR